MVPSYASLKFLSMLEVVFGREELAALDAEDAGDAEYLVGDLAVELEEAVQLAGWKEVPVGHLSASFSCSGWSARSFASMSGFMRRSTRPIRCIRRTGFQWRS